MSQQGWYAVDRRWAERAVADHRTLTYSRECELCGAAAPCPTARLALRIREGAVMPGDLVDVAAAAVDAVPTPTPGWVRVSLVNPTGCAQDRTRVTGMVHDRRSGRPLRDDRFLVRRADLRYLIPANTVRDQRRDHGPRGVEEGPDSARHRHR